MMVVDATCSSDKLRTPEANVTPQTSPKHRSSPGTVIQAADKDANMNDIINATKGSLSNDAIHAKPNLTNGVDSSRKPNGLINGVVKSLGEALLCNGVDRSVQKTGSTSTTRSGPLIGSESGTVSVPSASVSVSILKSTANDVDSRIYRSGSRDVRSQSVPNSGTVHQSQNVHVNENMNNNNSKNNNNSFGSSQSALTGNSVDCINMPVVNSNESVANNNAMSISSNRNIVTGQAGSVNYTVTNGNTAYTNGNVMINTVKPQISEQALQSRVIHDIPPTMNPIPTHIPTSTNLIPPHIPPNINALQVNVPHTVTALQNHIPTTMNALQSNEMPPTINQLHQPIITTEIPPTMNPYQYKYPPILNQRTTNMFPPNPNRDLLIPLPDFTPKAYLHPDNTPKLPPPPPAPYFTDLGNGVIMPPTFTPGLPVPGFVYGVPNNTTCYVQPSLPHIAPPPPTYDGSMMNTNYIPGYSPIALAPSTSGQFVPDNLAQPKDAMAVLPSTVLPYQTVPPTTVSMPAPLSPSASTPATMIVDANGNPVPEQDQYPVQNLPDNHLIRFQIPQITDELDLSRCQISNIADNQVPTIYKIPKRPQISDDQGLSRYQIPKIPVTIPNNLTRYQIPKGPQTADEQTTTPYQPPKMPPTLTDEGVVTNYHMPKMPPPVPINPHAYGSMLALPANWQHEPKGVVDTNLLLQLRMELVWHGEFDNLFSQYLPHVWYLMPTFYPPGERWQIFKDSAKVRFSCQCGHGWTSMKGRVIFWFYINYMANSGNVLFKLYGQECVKCKNGNYEHAMWYPEEVVKVIGNVYNRVGQLYYGFVRPPLRIDRRQAFHISLGCASGNMVTRAIRYARDTLELKCPTPLLPNGIPSEYPLFRTVL